MNHEKQIEKLIEQLKKVSGISFEITETDLPEDEVILRLKEMIAFYTSKDSKMGFMVSFLESQLKRDQAEMGFRNYHIEENAKRVPFLLESKQPYSKEAVRAVNALLTGDDMVLEVEANRLFVIREFEEEPTSEEIEQLALELIDMMETETFTSFNVSYDGMCESIMELPDMYQNLLMAMSIGNTFFSATRVFSYQDLGLGRLLYNISSEERKAFFGGRINEKVFKELDEETINTLNTFFENDLSIAETSRQLFLHRNTLIYKLDKFQGMTGLDVRRFRDAIVCKIALMLIEVKN